VCEKLSEDHPIMRAARANAVRDGQAKEISDPEWKRLRLTAWENRALKAEAALRELTQMVEYGEQHTPGDFWRFIFGEPGSGFRHASYRDAVNLLHEQIFNPERATVRGRYDVAADIIGLFIEYRDRHGKSEIEAKHCAATEYEESEDESV
jgi:hypothetical protein